MNLFKVAYKSFLETEKFRFSTRVAWWFQCRVNGNLVVARERNVPSNDSKNSPRCEAKETECKCEIEERN